MSEEHDRPGTPASHDGERTAAGPDREPGSPSGPTTGKDLRAGAGHGPRANGGSGTEGGTAGTGLDAMDEDALRHLLHDSVRDLEPSPDALEHLRRAVPARRARRRQAVVGAVAAALVCSVAVPTMLHIDVGPIGDSDKPMHNAGHAQDHLDEQQETGGEWGDSPAAGTGTDGGPFGRDDQGTQSGAPTIGGSAGPDPSSSLGPVSPTCTRDQLTGGRAVHGEADEQGRVYGSFTVVNTSDTSCTVEGDGIVLATVQGGATSTMIQVVDHTHGDEATALPDPVLTSSDEVVLEPEAGYVVRFAWVPRAGFGLTGCATSSPAPGGDSAEGGEGGEAAGEQGGPRTMGSFHRLRAGAGSGGAGGGGTSGGTGTGGGTGTEGGDADSDTSGGASGGASSGTGDGTSGSTGGDGDTVSPTSVVVTHTPDVGEPVAGTVTIEGACAGTVYRTGVLPAA